MTIKWENRDDAVDSRDKVTLVAIQTAKVMADYCRQYENYSDPYLEYSDLTEEEKELRAEREPHDVQLLKQGLEEISGWAEKAGIPFDVNIQTRIAKQLYSANGDVWNNSSVGC